ncbi:MAG TPA: hypothetical protein VKE22_18315 [Haliangiales bacterium]|nr:hypothetical protein [Haliangiales bacterium]
MERERIAAGLRAAGIDLVGAFSDGDRLVMVAGNGRALWPPFLAWLAEDPARPESPHPLQAYVEEATRRAVAGVDCEVRFAHDGPPFVPIQRLAERAGLAWLAPSNLSIHPVVGPWLSLRAVIVADDGEPVVPAPPPPCAACPSACLPAFERARAARDPVAAQTAWPTWLAVRDACPIGREHRFQEDHIRYGYTKDREILRKALSESRRTSDD